MKIAFTLAEVLITLGIIGVVAALTMPALIDNYQKKVTAKRLSQTYSQLYQAINQAQADYGDMRYWDIASVYGSGVPSAVNQRIKSKIFADTYILPYMNKTSQSEVVELNAAGYSAYTSKDGRIYLPKNYMTALVSLANGVTLMFGFNGNADTITYPIIFVDINGKSGPNILGRDFFGFELDAVTTMKLKPFGYNGLRSTLLNYCASDPAGSVWRNLYCTGLIMQDGWEIKDDYPW